MAKIWFARDGSDPTTGESRYDRPLQQCVEQLGLAQESQRLCGLDQRPVIGDQGPLPQDSQHVVCQVDDQEASEHGWAAGYYRLGISPKEVAKRLGPPEAG